MNLFRKKPQPRTEPAPAPAAPVNPLILAEQELDAATGECLRLDEERRAWAAKREGANTRFNAALTAYHVALDKAEQIA
jgi:hypothetical protein